MVYPPVEDVKNEDEEEETGQEEAKETEVKDEALASTDKEPGEENQEEKAEEKKVDYKAEAEKWEKSYNENRSHKDRLVAKKDLEIQELKRMLGGSKPLANKKPAFERKDPIELAEMKAVDPKAYDKYLKDQDAYTVDIVKQALEQEQKKREEVDQLIGIQKALYEAHPALNPESDKFNKEYYDKVNDFMVANGMGIKQAKIAADHLSLKEEVKKVGEKAKEDAIRNVKKKEDENIEKEAPKAKTEESEDKELSEGQNKYAARFGLKSEEVAEAIDLNDFNI